MLSLHKVAMVGPALDSRGGAASLAALWRDQGFFRRWPVEYLAVRSDAGLARNARLLARAVQGLGSLIGGYGPVAVHAHVCARTGLWREGALMALAAAARCPLVVQLHGGGFERFYDEAGTPVKAAVRAMLEGAAAVLVPCESARQWVRAVTRAARVACLPPAVAPFAGKTDARSSTILFLARLEAAKGIFDLLEAVAAVRASVPDLRLVCAGEGDRATVGRFAARLGIADAVQFTGTVGPSGKRALLESAAVLAQPSYAEGMPLGVLEAMAAGVPVVASPVGGVPEVIADGTSGLLAAPGDKAALARLLKRVLTDRAGAARLGAAARETARLRFAPERSVALLDSLYADLGVRGAARPAEPKEPRQGWRHAA